MIPLSYLKFYFPEAKFVPLIAPPYFERGEISQIATFLSKSLPEDTLFVASVDFSHNNMLLEAAAKNKETENTIRNFDFETLYQYKDDHLDSPASIGLLLSTMQRLGTTNWELWYDSHGGLIEDEFTLQGTSYLIGIFFK
jgi:poly-gamma-glutamate synthesis protein (capsule biosynthesis protein)